MVLVLFAHPDPLSLTAEAAHAAEGALHAEGIETHLVDLYRMRDGRPFPPVLEIEELRRKTSFDAVVQEQMSLVENARGFVVAHPDWWGGPPAVLKGWLDRVLRPGTAYEIPEGHGHRNAEGLLAARKAVIAVTGDDGSSGPLEGFWKERVWKFCGVEADFVYLPRTREASKAERDAYLEHVASIAIGAFSGE
jgi:NAD(P)H dehydrogenase (quinone)